MNIRLETKFERLTLPLPPPSSPSPSLSLLDFKHAILYLFTGRTLWVETIYFWKGREREREPVENRTRIDPE